MTIALAFGFFFGLSLIIYRGLYLGSWSVALSTLGSCVVAAVVIYIFLRILISVGSLILRLFLILLFIGAVFSAKDKLMDIFLGHSSSSSVSNNIKTR